MFTPPSSRKRRNNRGSSLKRKKLRRGSTSSSKYVSTSSNPLFSYTSSSVPETPTPRRYFRKGRRVAAQAAGAVLGYIHGNVPGIVQGAHYAGKAFDYFEPEEQLKRSYSSTQKNNSMYSGKLNRPKPYDQSIESKILKQGYLATSEVHGKVTDAYCTYMQHSTWWAALMAKSFGGALLRKLFKKAGLEISDRIGTLPLYNINDGSGFRLEYSTMNPSTNSIITYNYDTVAGSTLDSVLTMSGPQFVDQIEYYLNGNTGNVNQPHKLSLYTHDNNVALVHYRLCASIQIPNEVAEFHVTSVLKVQNRTQGDLAASGNLDLERLDSQPVVCTTYSFPGAPLLKNVTSGSSQITLSGISNAGLKLYGSASFPSDISFENRPNVSIFANCNKKSNSVLQPGQMKTSYCKYDFKGKISTMLPKHRLESNIGGIITGVKCKTELIVFEEMMRTSGSNPVHINYERKFKIGCIVTTKKDNFALQPFTITAELNYP